MRRKARLLTEDDLHTFRQMIAGIGGGAGTPGILLREITFEQAVGGIAAGTTFAVGTRHDDILERIARRPTVPPTYRTPTLTLSGDLPDTPEVGSSVAPVWTPGWTRNDAGEPTGYLLTKNGITLKSATAPMEWQEPAFSLTETGATYRASVTYREGPVLPDSDGNASPRERIAAGTVSSHPLVVSAFRYGFHETDPETTVPSTSAAVRALRGRIPRLPGDGTLTIIAPTGTRRITIWSPQGWGGITSIRHAEQGDADYLDLFTLRTVTVEGANGYVGVAYDGRTWITAVPTPAVMSFRVRFGSGG